MAIGKALDGKPYAGNPHVRFDEGEVAPAATPRRGSLLYRIQQPMKKAMSRRILYLALVVAASAALAESYIELDIRPEAVTDYWNCTGHANPTVSQQTAALAGTLATTMFASDRPSAVPAAFESRCKSVGSSAPMTVLTRRRRGFMLLVH